MLEASVWTDLGRYAVLEATPDLFFDKLTELAARLSEARAAQLALIVEDGRRFDCAFGMPPAISAGSESPPLGICAEFLLVTPRGLALGSLQILDVRPRVLTAPQHDAMQLLILQLIQQVELRRSADALRRKAEQLERTQAIAHIGGWELDFAGKELTWTDETYRLHEVTGESYTPDLDSAIAFYTPAGAALIRAAVQETLQTGTPYDLETELVTRTGRHRWVRTVGQREDVDGRPRRIFGVLQDITERRQLESEILLIAQREQNRIGFDLHDGLGQALTGISLLVHNVTNRLSTGQGALRDELVHIETLVREAIGTCRLLAHGLSPVSRDRGGLRYALQTLATQIDQLHGIEVGVTARGPEPDIDESVADHLYRIAQEAITNAIRHAAPRRITVFMESHAAQVALSVSDDGKGFGSGPSGGPGTGAGFDGMGLRIMRYRARLIGATLSIRRRPEGGTRVHCKLANGTRDRADSGTVQGSNGRLA